MNFNLLPRAQWCDYRTSANSFLPWIVFPLQSFRGNYSIYEVKNCHNAETIWKFPHFLLSEKNCFHGNYMRKYGTFFTARKCPMGSGLWSLNPGKSCYEMKERDWLYSVGKIKVVKFLAKRMDENIEKQVWILLSLSLLLYRHSSFNTVFWTTEKPCYRRSILVLKPRKWDFFISKVHFLSNFILK